MTASTRSIQADHRRLVAESARLRAEHRALMERVAEEVLVAIGRSRALLARVEDAWQRAAPGATY